MGPTRVVLASLAVASILTCTDTPAVPGEGWPVPSRSASASGSLPPELGSEIDDDSHGNDPDVVSAWRDAGETTVQQRGTEDLELVATDGCDDSDYAGQDWLATTSEHFVAYTLPGTAAEADVEEVLELREQAYAAIVAALGIEYEPRIELYLSPNRLAAAAHGVGSGAAYPGADRIEVVYTGASDSYEAVRYGHELTHVLAHYLDPGPKRRLPILDEGLAEYMDQSGRNLHVAYAAQLGPHLETRTQVVSLDQRDVWGSGYGRAGSLVQHLIERHGLPLFVDVWRAASMVWQDGCFRHPASGCVEAAADVTEVLDAVLREEVGESWKQTQDAWRPVVEAALARGPRRVSSAAAVEIGNLLALMDAAINDGDALLYRSTMEGFYCDWRGEAGRRDIAQRSVAAFESAQTTPLIIYDTGVRNFPTAAAMVTRKEGRGFVSAFRISFEKLPVGWRVAWAPDWER